MEREPHSLYLEKKTDVSLHDRFSQVLLEQLTQRTVLCKKNQKSLVLRLRNIPRAQIREDTMVRTPNKGNIWTRLDWRRNMRQGAWNFRNKYRCKLRFSFTPKFMFSPAAKSRFSPNPKSRFSPRFMCTPKSSLTPTRRFSFPRNLVAQGGGLKKRGLLGQTGRQFKDKPRQSRLSGRLNLTKTMRRQPQRQTNKSVPTKKELDADLDAYMSKSKSHLDKELDTYMSLSKSRLDAELDEYMAMAGQTSMWE